MRFRALLLLLLAMQAAIAPACAETSGKDAFSGAAELDHTIESAILAGTTPGAVLLIGHDGKILYRKAYGNRALVPKSEPMTLDTIFDAASLTKVIATTSCLMKLFDQGKFDIDEPVTAYLPEFQGGHSPITVRNLMTHFSGLRPDLVLEPPWTGYQTGVIKALNEQPTGPPGTKFVYSDINFILLGEIVHRLSGQTLTDFAREQVFIPLEMKDTRFRPPASEIGRIAPTEFDPAGGGPLRGVVHDPTARFMGGVAGDAGLFTTADDLSKFAQMMLDGGTFRGKRVFSPAAIAKFTSPQSPPNQPVLRGLGWDIDSPLSRNRGDLFPIGSYGHTGYTGTSIWIDPESKTYLIFLTNYIHPRKEKRSLTALRSRVATITASSVGYTSLGHKKTAP
jgi:CubicO group peptidase (beta-lactamase class C family)